MMSIIDEKAVNHLVLVQTVFIMVCCCLFMILSIRLGLNRYCQLSQSSLCAEAPFSQLYIEGKRGTGFVQYSPDLQCGGKCFLC